MDDQVNYSILVGALTLLFFENQMLKGEIFPKLQNVLEIVQILYDYDDNG